MPKELYLLNVLYLLKDSKYSISSERALSPTLLAQRALPTQSTLSADQSALPDQCVLPAAQRALPAQSVSISCEPVTFELNFESHKICIVWPNKHA